MTLLPARHYAYYAEYLRTFKAYVRAAAITPLAYIVYATPPAATRCHDITDATLPTYADATP